MSVKSSSFVLICMLLFISFMPVEGTTSHSDYDSLGDDPGVITSYLAPVQSLFASMLDAICLNDNDLTRAYWNEANGKLLPLHNSINDANAAGIQLVLSDYADPFFIISENSNSLSETHARLIDSLIVLEGAQDLTQYESMLSNARKDYFSLIHSLGVISAQASTMRDLGITSIQLEDSIDEYESELDVLDGRLMALEDTGNVQSTYFYLDVSYAPELPGLNYIAYGAFYFNGEPVDNNPIVLHINAQTTTLLTDKDGSYTYTYKLPETLDTDSLTFYATTLFNGDEFSTNIVVMDLYIETELSIERKYSFEEDISIVTLFGYLTDVDGAPIGGNAIGISLNGTVHTSITDTDGSYTTSYSLDVGSGMMVHAFSEFIASEDSPYLDCRSQDISFYLSIPASEPSFDDSVPGFLDSLYAGIIQYYYLIITFFAVALIIVLVRALKKRNKNDTNEHVSEETPYSDFAPDATFEKELSLIEKLTNKKESVIFGYSSLLDFLEKRKLLKLTPSMTHNDIDRRMKQIRYTQEESPLITSVFEISRYSNRGITKTVSDTFFSSLYSISKKIRGDIK